MHMQGLEEKRDFIGRTRLGATLLAEGSFLPARSGLIQSTTLT